MRKPLFSTSTLGYSDKRFNWSEKAFELFYVEMYDKMRTYAFHAGLENGIRNFEDIFQETMLALYKLRNSQAIRFQTKEDAASMVRRIFRFATVNDYRREKRHRHVPLPHEDVLTQQQKYVEETIQPLHRCTELFFPEVDGMMARNSQLFTKRQRVFYDLYRELIFRPIADRTIQEIIAAKMKISHEYYQVLKSQVMNLIEKLVPEFNFVTR